MVKAFNSVFMDELYKYLENNRNSALLKTPNMYHLLSDDMGKPNIWWVKRGEAAEFLSIEAEGNLKVTHYFTGNVKGNMGKMASAGSLFSVASMHELSIVRCWLMLLTYSKYLETNGSNNPFETFTVDKRYSNVWPGEIALDFHYKELFSKGTQAMEVTKAVAKAKEIIAQAEEAVQWVLDNLELVGERGYTASKIEMIDNNSNKIFEITQDDKGNYHKTYK